MSEKNTEKAKENKDLEEGLHLKERPDEEESNKCKAAVGTKETTDRLETVIKEAVSKELGIPVDDMVMQKINQQRGQPGDTAEAIGMMMLKKADRAGYIRATEDRRREYGSELKIIEAITKTYDKEVGDAFSDGFQAAKNELERLQDSVFKGGSKDGGVKVYFNAADLPDALKRVEKATVVREYLIARLEDIDNLRNELEEAQDGRNKADRKPGYEDCYKCPAFPIPINAEPCLTCSQQPKRITLQEAQAAMDGIDTPTVDATKKFYCLDCDKPCHRVCTCGNEILTKEEAERQENENNAESHAVGENYPGPDKKGVE